MFQKIVNYCKESYDELVHKTTWPTRKELSSSAVVVLYASLLIALVVFCMDSVFQFIMENIIYNELRTRGYSVDVGMVEIRKPDKDGKWIRTQLEVDFIANIGSKKYYIQSALSIPDREKEIQESRSLTNINDSFKKVIIVKDHIMPRRNEEGILTIGLFDFLLKEDSLDL